MAIEELEIGLKFVGTVSLQEWQNYGKKIRKQELKTYFSKGDWANYGKTYEGVDLAVFADLMGWTAQILGIYRNLARNIPYENREKRLSIGHHRLVAHLDPAGDQRRWLQKAVDGKWSVSRMRQKLQGVGYTSDVDSIVVFPRSEAELEAYTDQLEESGIPWRRVKQRRSAA